jgi:trimeric autotransporter adhesin
MLKKIKVYICQLTYKQKTQNMKKCLSLLLFISTFSMQNVLHASNPVADESATAIGCTANAVISGGCQYCEGTSPTFPACDIIITLDGEAPYSFVYTDGTNNFAVNNHNSTTYTVPSPTSGVTYTMISVTDNTDCDGTISGSAIIQQVAAPVIGGATQVCIGLTANVTPSTGGTWSSSNTGVATVTNGGVVTGVSAGTSTLTFTNTTSGCSNTVLFTVNPLPVIGGATQVCIGLTANVTPSTGGTWSSSNTGVATVTNGGVVTGVSAGTSTLTFTNTTTGCSNTVLFTVNPLPVIGGATQVCIGLTANVTPSTGGTWSSSNTGVATVTNGGVVTGVSAGTSTLTFTNTTTGCSNTVLFTVNPLPVIGGATQVCIGLTANVTPSTGGTWSSSNTGVATVTNGGVVTGVSAGTSTLTFTNTTSGCSNTVLFTVNPAPTANNLNLSLCEDAGTPGVTSGVNLTLNNTSINNNGSATFTWYESDGTTLVANPTNTTVSNGDVFIVEVSFGGCTNTATVTYTVTETITLNNPNPVLCEDAFGSGQVTNHDLTQYNNSVFAGATTYVWAGGNTQTITNGMTINVEVTSGNCSNNIDVTFTVNSQVTAGNDNLTNPICNTSGSTIDLNTLLSGNNATGTWAETTASGQFNTTTGVFNASGLTAGTYNFTYTVAGSAPCPNDVANFSVQVNQEVTAGDDNAFQLCSSATSPENLNDYLSNHDLGGVWAETSTTPSGQFNAGTGVLDPTGLALGVYTFMYTVSGVDPCPNADATITVTIVDNIELINPEPTFCEDALGSGQVSNVDLTQFNNDVFLNGDVYTWYEADGTTLVSDPTNVTVTASTTFIVEVGEGDCLANGEVTFIINSLPTATITGTRSAICEGEELPDLIISFTGEGPWTYNLNGIEATTSDNPLIFTSPANGGTFTVTTVSDANCSNTANSSSTQIIVTNPLASFDSNPNTGAAPLEVFFTNTSNGTSFSWEFGDGNTSTAENPTNTYTELGEYIVTLTITVNGCTATATDTIIVIGGSIVDLPNVFSPDGMGGNELFKSISENMSFERFQIFNRWGQMLYEGPAWDGTYNGEKAPEGTYYYVYYGEGTDGKIYEGKDYTGQLNTCKKQINNNLNNKIMPKPSSV